MTSEGLVLGVCRSLLLDGGFFCELLEACRRPLADEQQPAKWGFCISPNEDSSTPLAETCPSLEFAVAASLATTVASKLQRRFSAQSCKGLVGVDALVRANWKLGFGEELG